MNVLSPRIHAALDYLSVLVLVLAPTLFGLNDVAATGAYALAAIHLALTLLTDFPGGVMKVVPLRVHGAVEIVVGVLLVLAPLVIPAATDLGMSGRIFFIGFGAVLVVVWAITDYVGVHTELHDDLHTGI
ncbi:MAG TPA: hypothetical protein VNU21_11570 [Usitatibacter sp.]|nr:hypothetical protein [Usitatibacter sp.]